MKASPWVLFTVLTSLSFALSGCKHEEPNFTYMPDMAESPAYKAQEEGVMNTPVKGTIPRGYKTPRFANDPVAAGRGLKNPVSMTRKSLYRGMDRFNTYCIVCHGPMGEGDGTIVPKFPRPPSLQSAKVRGMSDGRIYHIISHGQNLMPSYASQIPREDRWKIVHYIRAMHRAKKPTEADIKAYDKEYGG